MAEYLNRIGAGLILLDAAPLSYDWVPPKVVGREQEQEQLAGMFASIGTSGMSCRAVITGNVGSGKTVLSRSFADDLTRHLSTVRAIQPVHVNCRNHPTTSLLPLRPLLRLRSNPRNPKEFANTQPTYVANPR